MNEKHAEQWRPLLNLEPQATHAFLRQALDQGRSFLRQKGCEDRQEAEDLVMEAFRRMLDNVKNGKCRFDSAPSTYLRSIVQNCWREALRKKKKPKPRERGWIIEALESWGYLLFEKKNGPMPETADPLAAQIKEALKTAHAQLRENCKHLLAMRYGNPPKSYEAMSDEQKTTVKYIKTQLQRCRRYFKDKASAFLEDKRAK